MKKRRKQKRQRRTEDADDARRRGILLEGKRNIINTDICMKGLRVRTTILPHEDMRDGGYVEELQVKAMMGLREKAPCLPKRTPKKWQARHAIHSYSL